MPMRGDSLMTINPSALKRGFGENVEEAVRTGSVPVSSTRQFFDRRFVKRKAESGSKD
jgi:hypothetical protein